MNISAFTSVERTIKNKYIVSVARTVAINNFKEGLRCGFAKIEAEERMGKERECSGKT